MNSLKSLFAEKLWANSELFNLLATVDTAQHAPAIHTAMRTLNHIYVVDRIFQAHLLAKEHGYRAANTEETPEMDILHFQVAETDAWYEGYAGSVSEAQLKENIPFRFTDGDNGTMTREEMLLHIILHGSYHRGNVGQVLKSIGIVPPRDLYTKFLHLGEPERRRA